MYEFKGKDGVTYWAPEGKDWKELEKIGNSGFSYFFDLEEVNISEKEEKKVLEYLEEKLEDLDEYLFKAEAEKFLDRKLNTSEEIFLSYKMDMRCFSG